MIKKLLLIALVCIGQVNASDKLNVVASFSILGDLIKNIGGENVDVKSIVGANEDAHVYRPTPETSKLILQADLIIINGFGFEGWMDRLMETSGYKGPVIIATKGLKSPFVVDDEGEKIMDPHTWLTVPQVKVYCQNILDALIAKDPESKQAYQKNFDAYLKKLDVLDQEIRTSLSQIPVEKRKVVTAHDAFGSYEKEYDLAFYAPQGISTESEPSAKDIADLIDQIRREDIRAIFVENIAPERLIKRLAQEVGIVIEEDDVLYSDALSEPDGPAPTYIDLMRYNTKTIVKALQH